MPKHHDHRAQRPGTGFGGTLFKYVGNDQTDTSLHANGPLDRAANQDGHLGAASSAIERSFA